MFSKIIQNVYGENLRGSRPAGHIPKTRSGKSFDISKGKRCLQNRTASKVEATVHYKLIYKVDQ